jgi:glutathione S-transferase
MTTRQLFSGPLSMFGAKVEIALREKDLPFDLVMVPFDFANGYKPIHPQVFRINPKSQVPVLIDGDVELFDSTQIFEYLEHLAPTPPLWPQGIAERACARLLEHQSDEVFFPQIIRLMGLQSTPNAPEADLARNHAVRYYDRLESRLDTSMFLAGDFSYADIAFYMAQFFGERMGALLSRSAHPQLCAWRDRMTARPAVATVIGAMCGYLRSQSRPVPAFIPHGI